jgi:hypothetical protein
MPNGSVLDRAGRLIDGQHRLTAITELQRPLPLRVTYNADRSLLYTIDTTQSSKDLSDALRFDRAPVGVITEIASAARLLFRAEQGVSILDNSLQPSNEEGVEVYRNHRDGLIEAAKLASRLCRIVPSRGVVTYNLFLALPLDEEAVRSFVHRIATGVDLKAGDPALLVRNTYMHDRAARITRSLTDQAIIIATALNAVLRGKKLLSWRSVEFGKGKIPPIGR